MIDTVHVGTCNNLFCYQENKMIQIKMEDDDTNMIIGLNLFGEFLYVQFLMACICSLFLSHNIDLISGFSSKMNS